MFKLPYNLIAFDLETTSADSGKGSIIQVGALKIDMDFKILGTYQAYVKPMDDYWEQEAEDVHGLSREFLAQNGIDIKLMLGQFERFAGGERELAAWGNYFDIPFLGHQYFKLGKKFPFSNRPIDLKSIAIWEMAKRGKPMYYGVEQFLQAVGMEFKGGAHDALADIGNAIRILNYFKNGT